ncbi:MAG: DinB family protein, partial [Planctomycetales bacterium]
MHDANAIAERFHAARRATEKICEPLEIEDFCVQSMPDASPIKWHLAHTSWFFETFVLSAALPDHQPDPQYAVLFNSYYNAVGEQHARPERGVLSRPTVAEIMDYRSRVGCEVEALLSEGDSALLPIIETGIHHEQQHQELMLMDLKHAFDRNPLRPVYRAVPAPDRVDVLPLKWIPFEGRLTRIGHDGNGFAFDNESPRHQAYVASFQIANRLITCGEYAEFMEDGGYDR